MLAVTTLLLTYAFYARAELARRFPDHRHLAQRHAERSINSTTHSLARRGPSPAGQIFNGDATYYYDINGLGPCRSSQPPAVQAFAETNGYPRCEGPYLKGITKKLGDYQNNKIVAINNKHGFNFDDCGREIIVVTQSGQEIGGFVLWDQCEACNGGLDFSATEFAGLFGGTCDAGRLSVTYKFSDNQIMPKKAATESTLIPAYQEQISRERMGDKACPLTQVSPQTRRCTPDRKAVEWCHQDNSDNDQTQGLLWWQWNFDCPPGTFCDPSIDGTQLNACALRA